MKLKVVLMEEADAFMYSLPRKAYQRDSKGGKDTERIFLSQKTK